MARSELLEPFILKWEGGFVNDPDDLGGATNKGITFATYKSFRKKKGLPQPTIADLKRLRRAEWKEIFQTMYWDSFRGNEIDNQNIANICVDWLWMSGKTAIRRVQAIVGTTVDGIVGPKTIACINSKSPLPLFGQIKNDRKKYYYEICDARPANNKFLRGWLNRLNEMNYED